MKKGFSYSLDYYVPQSILFLLKFQNLPNVGPSFACLLLVYPLSTFLQDALGLQPVFMPHACLLVGLSAIFLLPKIPLNCQHLQPASLLLLLQQPASLLLLLQKPASLLLLLQQPASLLLLLKQPASWLLYTITAICFPASTLTATCYLPPLSSIYSLYILCWSFFAWFVVCISSLCYLPIQYLFV